MSINALLSEDHPEPIEPPASTLRDQREANQHLVLAALRAAEDAEDARSARFLAEEERNGLKTTTEELRATAEARERLIGVVGHDLRTPLNAMTMAGSLMLAHGHLNDADRRLALRIVESGRRVAHMITQLTEFTRARLGESPALRRSSTDLGQVCRSIAEELRIGSDVEIRQVSSGDVLGYWDADGLAAVLSNLAGNAVRFATCGTPVLIRTYGDDESVTTEVTNYGVPIPPELLLSIFEPFRRGESTDSTRAGHLGLGLYIAYEIARAHGGSIDVSSADARTTFTLRLPRVPADASR